MLSSLDEDDDEEEEEVVEKERDSDGDPAGGDEGRGDPASADEVRRRFLFVFGLWRTTGEFVAVEASSSAAAPSSSSSMYGNWPRPPRYIDS